MEEARETPVLNVVDPANVAETKSFPPRLVLIISFTLFCVALAALWVLAVERWQRISYDDPGKLLVQSVYHSVVDCSNRLLARLPWGGLRVWRRDRNE